MDTLDLCCGLMVIFLLLYSGMFRFLISIFNIIMSRAILLKTVYKRADLFSFLDLMFNLAPVSGLDRYLKVYSILKRTAIKLALLTGTNVSVVCLNLRMSKLPSLQPVT